MKRRSLARHIDRRGLRKHRYQDVSLDPILNQIKAMCRSLVSVVSRTAANNPQYSSLLASVLVLTSFWEAVNGVRDIGIATKRAYDKLMLKIRGKASSAARLEGGAIIQKLIEGIAKLSIVFFQLLAAKKLREFALNSY